MEPPPPLSFASRLGAVSIALAIGLGAGPLAAAEPTARELYESGAQAYREARYETAIELLLQAQRLEPHPELHYDLGRAYEGAGNLRRAIASFREYLRLEPNAKDHAVVEARVSNLERRLISRELELAERERTERHLELQPIASSLPPATPPAEPTGIAKISLPAWIALGVGVGALGTALGFELARRGTEQDARDAQTQLGHQERYRIAERNRDLSRLFLGIGAAAALSSGVLLYLDLGQQSSAPSVGLVGSGRF